MFFHQRRDKLRRREEGEEKKEAASPTRVQLRSNYSAQKFKGNNAVS